MSNSDKLEDYKKEIRSILIPFQKGCYLSEFNRAYKELIGRRLPIRELGFTADIEFLYSIPDVVKITPTRTGEYHLQGIADEKSKHIQKMVSRQKPAKSKPLPRSIRSTKAYVLPPRFTETSSKQVKKLPEPKLPSRTVPKEEPKWSPITIPKEEPKLPPKTVPKEEPKFPPKTIPTEEPILSPKASPKDEVIALVQYFKERIPLEDLLSEYERMYKKSLSLSKYGFASVQECIDDIPELDLVYKNNCLYVVYVPEYADAPDNYETNSIQDTLQLSSDRSSFQNGVHYTVKCTPLEMPSTYDSDCSRSQSYSKDNIPDSLRKKLQMVAEKNPQGIWAPEFPACFEEVTTSFLDLHSLGYRCLNDLIDDVPDIFIRKLVPGSKKDNIIYPTDKFRPELNGSMLIDHVILNLRKILEAYPEGINIQDLLRIYSVNCRDTLHIKDMGFDNIETFLSSIKNNVPLRFESVNGVKTIHLLKLSDTPADLYNMAPEAFQKEAIPFDATFPNYQFKPQILPVDFDSSKFIPVYTSSVANPGHLYIQLQGEETTVALAKLAGNMLNFYNGNNSKLYIMKSIHIKVGASCVAQWPFDQLWYRAQIVSIPSMETVLVHYVDYGTRETVPKCLLRYLKKEYIDLPSQAIKCCLAYLKPGRNAAKWDIQTRNRILSMCEDVSLMAKIEEIRPDGVYSILLCDTNGEEDVYINDVLRNEGLADYIVAESIKNALPSPEPVQLEYHHNLNPLQALQAQYFLQAFAAVAPSFSQNENYIKLLKQVSIYCPNSDPLKQNIGMPQFAPAVGPPGFNAHPPNVNAFAKPNASLTAFSMPATPLGANLVNKHEVNIPAFPVHAPDHCTRVSEESETFTSPKSVAIPAVDSDDAESEIFDEDNDEIFQQFCQKVSSTKIRCVKRVLLGDGYRIHVIVVESKPFASSGDISHLIWNNKEADYLMRRLQLKDVDLPARSLSEDGNEELFQLLEKFNVKGFQKTSGFKSSILLYPLKVVIKILNLFGHPSVTLRTKLTEEIANFDPNDPDWMDNSSPDPPEPEEDENFSGVTDDDKIEKLCLFDLLAMKESLICRRKKMSSLNDLSSNSKSDEINKLEQLHQKVLQRIQEIKEICNVFA